MFKIMINKAPDYLISLIPKRKQTFQTRNKHLLNYNCSTDCFKYSFFPCTINDWFQFSKVNYSFMRRVQNNILNIFDSKE